MQTIDLPTFDQVLIQMLGLVGVSGAVLVLVTAALAVQSWHDGARLTIRIGRLARRGAGAAGAALKSMRPIRGVAAVLITLLALAAQLLTVGMCFVGGNYVTTTFDNDRWQRAVASLSADPIRALNPASLAPFLTLDLVSGGYVVLAVGVLVWSYRLAWTDRDARRSDPLAEDRLGRAGALLGWPAIIVLGVVVGGLAILAILELFVVALTLLAGSDVPAELEDFLRRISPGLITGVVGLAYLLACQAAVRASRLVVRVWRDQLLSVPTTEGW